MFTIAAKNADATLPLVLRDCAVHYSPPMRRFPAPWTVEAIDAGFKVIDSNGQSLAYVYGHADKRDAETAKGLTLDEARRIASNIAKLPTLPGRG
jgi:hypothetical protein